MKKTFSPPVAQYEFLRNKIMTLGKRCHTIQTVADFSMYGKMVMEKYNYVQQVLRIATLRDVIASGRWIIISTDL